MYRFSSEPSLDISCFNFSGRSPRLGGKHGDAAVELGFVDLGFLIVGNLGENEEQLQLAGGLIFRSATELFDVGFDLLAGHAAHHQVHRPTIHTRSAWRSLMREGSSIFTLSSRY